MERFIYKLVTCFALAIFFVSCTVGFLAPTVPVATPEEDLEAKKFICPADKARIYVYRLPTSAGSAASMTIDIDMKRWGAINIENYLMLDVKPGFYIIRVWDDTNKSINVEAGKIYFIETMMHYSGDLIVKQVSEGEGKENVRKSKLVRGMLK